MVAQSSPKSKSRSCRTFLKILNHRGNISAPFCHLNQVTGSTYVHCGNTKVCTPREEVYWRLSLETATRRDRLCSPTVPSRLGIKAVDGAVAHDIVFTGLLDHRYKFSIHVHLFSSSFSLGRNSGIKFWLSLLTCWFLSLDVSVVSLTLA